MGKTMFPHIQALFIIIRLIIFVVCFNYLLEQSADAVPAKE